MSESTTSKRRMKASERQAKAMELRAQGRTFSQIAGELGYRGPSGAYKAVSTGLQKTLREPAAELRTLESERLDRLLDGVWAKATKGQTPAIRAAIALMERRARLWGLDQPTKLEIGRLLESSDWIMVRDRIKTALEPFPEALQSVIGALKGIDNE